MENMSYVEKLRPLFWPGTDSVVHCVLIMFHLDVADDDCGTVNCAETIFVVAFNDDRLLGASSIDDFCDKAELKMECQCISFQSLTTE